jgi:hypothetical protein
LPCSFCRERRGNWAGGEAGIQRLRKFSPLDAEENRVEPGFEGDAEVTVEQLEMLERNFA